MKFYIILGAVFAFLAVAFGAFGAHALKNILTDHYAAVWETAVQYQMFHALGLIVIGILMSKSLIGPTPCDYTDWWSIILNLMDSDHNSRCEKLITTTYFGK